MIAPESTLRAERSASREEATTKPADGSDRLVGESVTVTVRGRTVTLHVVRGLAVGMPSRYAIEAVWEGRRMNARLFDELPEWQALSRQVTELFDQENPFGWRISPSSGSATGAT